MKILSTLFFILLMAYLVTAQVAIQSFDTIPSKVLPGEKLKLRINLENVGDNDINNILVKLDLVQVPFAPLVSSTEQVIAEINDNDEKTIVFELVALPNAESQIYKVPVEVSFGENKKISLISLEVNAKVNIDVILDSTDIKKVNNQGKVILKFVNNGLTQIKFLKVTLEENPAYEILSAKSIYIGEVDVDDFESEEFTVISNSNNPQLFFTLEYRDFNNKEFKEAKRINLNIYTEEEARQLGLVKDNFNWIFVALILVNIILIYFYRRKKKNVN